MRSGLDRSAYSLLLPFHCSGYIRLMLEEWARPMSYLPEESSHSIRPYLCLHPTALP